MDKAKFFTMAFAAVAASFLSACSSLTNLTPEKVPENSSRIYTLSMSAYINDGSVIQDSIEPFVVIDEKTIPMKEVKNINYDRFYEFDYSLPPNRKGARYYFLLKYKADNSVSGVIRDRQITSPTVYSLDPVRRYVVDMQNERGPVGSIVPVLGRGFDKLDKIYVDGKETDTEYVSRTTMTFAVPPLAAGKNYDVELVGTHGRIWVGQFRVDTASLDVSPASLEIAGGEVSNVIFNIGFKAPAGGFPIDVKTNIPSSVVMEDVIVPEGQSSVSVTVKGAAEGKGSLFANAVGFREKIVPVVVSKSDSQESVLGEVSDAISADKKPVAPLKPASADASKLNAPITPAAQSTIAPAGK